MSDLAWQLAGRALMIPVPRPILPQPRSIPGIGVLPPIPVPPPAPTPKGTQKVEQWSNEKGWE